MKIFAWTALLLAASGGAFAQPQPAYGCDSPESKQLDFWVGEWDLTSTFDRPSKQWKQAWVDNTATYLDFTGAIVDGRMTFSREVQRDGRRSKQRMVFDKVTSDSLKWLWQRSDDDGKAWTTLWEIDYRRVKS